VIAAVSVDFPKKINVKIVVGSTSSQSGTYEKFSPGAVAIIALCKWTPMLLPLKYSPYLQGRNEIQIGPVYLIPRRTHDRLMPTSYIRQRANDVGL